MPTRSPSATQIRALTAAGGSLLLALLLWGWVFRFGNDPAGEEAGAFWLRLILVWGLLALVSLLLMGSDRGRLFAFERRHLGLGIFSALLLYGLARLGWSALQVLFPDVPDPLTWALPPTSHDDGTGARPLWPVLPLLLGVAPAEEIYWRGFLQRVLVRQIGPMSGLFLGAGFYALAALWLGLPAALAAFVVGLVWGWIFLMERSLVPVMISHALWSVLVWITPWP